MLTEETNSAFELKKKVNVMDAIHWQGMIWIEVHLTLFKDACKLLDSRVRMNSQVHSFGNTYRRPGQGR